MATYGVHKSGSSEHGQWRLPFFNSVSTGLVGDESRAIEFILQSMVQTTIVSSTTRGQRHLHRSERR